MAHIAEFNSKVQHKAIVQRTRRMSPENSEEIRELVLLIEDADFSCQVNNSIGVFIKRDGEFGNSFHHRLYSVADIPVRKNEQTQVTLLVKRCSYVDEFSGEKYPGIASHFLCDSKVGDEIIITGPFEIPFKIPENLQANLILIGVGTGIAPFRAFIKHLYRYKGSWEGKIRLFYGAKSGLEMTYLNEQDSDLVQYYDQATFKAFKAVSKRPHWSDPILLDEALEGQSQEINTLLRENDTYIYIAGYKSIMGNLDASFSKIVGGIDKWKVRKTELIAGHKWAEILY